MIKTEYGIQLYSLRDITPTSLEAALEAVSKLGYSHVEFAGFFGHSAEEVKAMLEKHGLYVSGSHVGFDAIAPEKIDETAEYHRAIGCKRLIVPWDGWETKERLDANIEALNFADKKLKEYGMTLGYHNHAREFWRTPYGCIVEDEIISRTKIELEVDTFWTYNAGIDTLAFLQKNAERIKLIHLKDGLPVHHEQRNFAQGEDGVTDRSVGSGTAPIKEVCDFAKENGVTVIIESEGLDPTGIDEAARCIDYLRNMK